MILRPDHTKALEGRIRRPEAASELVTLVIERNEVSEGSLAQDEIREFEVEVADCLPRSGAQWLQIYLGSVKAIYAIQVLDTVYTDNGWEIFESLKAAFWNDAGGIFQADLEGFSNEEGYIILWQFSDDVTGDWWMAVMENGNWQKFKMDLGNMTHRLAFQAGQIPEGVERAN